MRLFSFPDTLNNNWKCHKLNVVENYNILQNQIIENKKATEVNKESFEVDEFRFVVFCFFLKSKICIYNAVKQLMISDLYIFVFVWNSLKQNFSFIATKYPS